jgi:DNA-binding CsgD family transcriptional regulator
MMTDAVPFASQALPVDLSSLSLGSPGPLERISMTWAEVWGQLVEARVRFRSTLWGNDRCVVVFHQSRSNVRQFALTDRELLVLQQTLDGESQKQIAAGQSLSASTIGASLKSALLKLGFPSQRHTAPIAALILSHEFPHPVTGAPPVYSISNGEYILAATHQVDWSRVPTLTNSEVDITRLLVQGKPNQEISRLRNTSLHTVENQVASLLRKAGARNRFDLLRTLYQPLRA